MQVWAGAKGRYWVRYWSLQAQRGLGSAHLCVSDVQMAAVWRRRWRGKETKEWAGLLEAEILVGRLAGHGSGEGARAISRKHAIDIISEAQENTTSVPYLPFRDVPRRPQCRRRYVEISPAKSHRQLMSFANPNSTTTIFILPERSSYSLPRRRPISRAHQHRANTVPTQCQHNANT